MTVVSVQLKINRELLAFIPSIRSVIIVALRQIPVALRQFCLGSHRDQICSNIGGFHVALRRVLFLPPCDPTRLNCVVRPVAQRPFLDALVLTRDFWVGLSVIEREDRNANINSPTVCPLSSKHV